MISAKVKNRLGERYGRLTVTKFSHIANTKGRNAYWDCVCDCGNKVTVGTQHLGKSTKSCGCIASENSRKRIKNLHNTGRHLYFIKCGEYTKIGRANNVQQRLSQIRAANPYPVELLKVFEEEGFKEKEYHEKYKEFHHSGEWFKIDIG